MVFARHSLGILSVIVGVYNYLQLRKEGVGGEQLHDDCVLCDIHHQLLLDTVNSGTMDNGHRGGRALARQEATDGNSVQHLLYKRFCVNNFHMVSLMYDVV